MNNAANFWLYASFAVSSMFAPAVCNTAGSRTTLFLGTLGYAVFVMALYGFRTEMCSGGAVVLAAAVNGVSAGLLWTAQGQLCLAYPTKPLKGTYFALFWLVFNVGGVVGGLITFSSNYSSEAAVASGATFLAFLIVMMIGSGLALTLRHPSKVVRSDGTTCEVSALPDVYAELAAILSLFTDRRMLMLSPLFLYSNWFLGYHFGVYNGGLFNARTQGFSTACYWGAEMAGAFVIGRFLDSKDQGPPHLRAARALGILFVWVNMTWYWGLTVLQHEEVDSVSGVRTPRRG